jgi:hypothetical protein
MHAHPNANATSIFTQSGKAAREFARLATASMVGVNIGVAAPMAYFPFGGRDSFFGDLKAWEMRSSSIRIRGRDLEVVLKESVHRSIGSSVHLPLDEPQSPDESMNR